MTGQNAKKYGCNCLTVSIVSAALGIVSGLSIFGTFLFAYWNYNAAAWGIVYTVLAALVLHLQVTFRRDQLQRVYSIGGLKSMQLVGSVGSVAVFVAFLVYVILAAVEKQGYRVDGYAPAAVFSLMNLKWTSVLYFASRRYRRILEGYDSSTNLVGNEQGSNGSETRKSTFDE